MANRFVKLRPVSSATNTPEAGDGSAQKVYITVNGLVDGAGIACCGEKVYIADYSKHVIYCWKKGDSASKIFAGAYGTSGSSDGAAGAARFNGPTGLACDKRGNVYVIDSGNNLIRKIDEAGNVYTLAAIPAVGIDQIGSIAVDDSDTIYYIDNTV